MKLSGKYKGKVVTKSQFERIVKQFIIFAKHELKISEDIPIFFIDDPLFAKGIGSFGEISQDNVIKISVINRHPMDVLRTVAHELEHYKQHMTMGIFKKPRSYAAKSLTENQATMKAGELMRKFGSLHPKYFELTAIK